MAPTHTGADESVSGRRRKPSRSPELSSPRPSKRHEPYGFSDPAYDNGALGMEDSRRNRLPCSRQGESSRHAASNTANANRKQGMQRTMRHFDSEAEFIATMLANDHRPRDRPENSVQPKRRDFPLNAPTLPAADRDIAPSQHDLRMPHAVIEVVTTDDLPLRDSVEYLKKMLRVEGGCKQLTKVCWDSSRFYAVFKNNDKGRKEAGACNAICKIKDLRLFDVYKLRAEKGSFGYGARPFSQDGSNDRNEHARATRHDRVADVAANTLGRPAKPFEPSETDARISRVMNGNDVPSSSARLSRTPVSFPPLPPLSYRSSSANRDDEQTSFPATFDTSESGLKEEKLCARCKKPPDDWGLFVRCSSCGRRYHESCSRPPVVGDVDRNVWQCFDCDKRKANPATIDASETSTRIQSSKQILLPSIDYTTSESLPLRRPKFPNSTTFVDEDERYLSPAGVVQSYQLSDGSKSMDISSISPSPSQEEIRTEERDHLISSHRPTPITSNAGTEEQRSSKPPPANDTNESVVPKPLSSTQERETRSASRCSDLRSTCLPVQDEASVSVRDDCRSELTAGSPVKYATHSPTSTPNCQKCSRKAFSGALCSKCKQDEDADFQAEILASLGFDDIVETTNANNNGHARTREEANTGGGCAPLDSLDGEEAGSPIDHHNARNEIGDIRRGSDHNPYSFLRNPGNNPAAKKFSQSSSWYRPPSRTCADCRRLDLPCTHITQPVEPSKPIRAHQTTTVVESRLTTQPAEQSPPPKPDLSHDSEVRHNAARKTAPEARRALSTTDTENESSDSTPTKLRTEQLPPKSNRRRETSQPTSVGSTNVDAARGSDDASTACLDNNCTHSAKPQTQQEQPAGKQQMASIPRSSMSQSNLSGSFPEPPADRNGLGQSFGGSRFAPNGISKPATPATITEAATQPPRRHGQGNLPKEINNPTAPLSSPPNASNDKTAALTTPKPSAPTSPTSTRVMHIRPNLYWNDLIYLALSRAEDGKLTSIAIAEWIQEEVPGYRNDPKVKSSISAVLSMYSKVKCLLYAKEDNPNRVQIGTRFVGPKWLYRLRPLYRSYLSIEYIEQIFTETRARDGRVPVNIPIPPTNRYAQPSFTESDERADDMRSHLSSDGDGTANELDENGRTRNKGKGHGMRKDLVARADESSDSVPLSRRYFALEATKPSASHPAKKSPGRQRKLNDNSSRVVSAPVAPLAANKQIFTRTRKRHVSVEASSASHSDSGSEVDIHGQPPPMETNRHRPRKSLGGRDLAALLGTLPTRTEKNKAPVSTAQTTDLDFFIAALKGVEMESENLHAPDDNKPRPRISSPKKDADTTQRGYFSELEHSPAPSRPHPPLGDPNFVAPNILDEFPESREREMKQNADELAYFKHWDDDPRYSKKDDFSCRHLFARRPDLHPDNVREGFDDKGKMEEIKARKLGRGDIQRWKRRNGGERMPDLKTSRRFRDPKTWWKDQGTKAGGWFDENDGDDEGGEDAGPGANDGDRMEVDDAEKYIESGEKRFKSLQKLFELPDRGQLELGLDKIGDLVFREKAGLNVSGRVKRGRKEFKTGHPDGLDL